MKELLEAIAMGLVDNSNDVQVRVVEGQQVTVFELRVRSIDPYATGRDGDERAETVRAGNP